MKISQLLVIVVLGTSCYANEQNTSKSNQYSNDSLAIKAKKLKQLYLLSTSSSSDVSNIYKQQFFDEFPCTFKQLDELYGDNLDVHHQPALLVGQAQPHIINLFNEITTINDTPYYKKLVSIAIGGHWDGDAVNFFQHGLINKVVSNPKLIVHILKGLSNDKIQSFWFFYFDGAVVEKKIDEPLQKIKAIDNTIYNLMVKAHDDAFKQNQ